MSRTRWQAIVDNNEGNPLGNFTYVFSTGAEIDTLEVAGHVLQAEDLEPVKGMIVGLHSDTCSAVADRQPVTAYLPAVLAWEL